MTVGFATAGFIALLGLLHLLLPDLVWRWRQRPGLSLDASTRSALRFVGVGLLVFAVAVAVYAVF